MDVKSIEKKIKGYEDDGKKLFTSSSFQTHSLVMLHILSRIKPDIPVFFLQTGYHFPESVAFKEEVTERFGLNTIDLFSTTPKLMQKDHEGNLLFASDPDYCCHLNKTMPMEPVLREYDIWVNGVRADQSATRSAMKTEQAAPHNVLRFHPMLDWSSKMIYDYIKEYDLPKHPLENKGYPSSIGCEPCTRKIDVEMQEREARWFGMNKTECGLHTELINTESN